MKLPRFDYISTNLKRPFKYLDHQGGRGLLYLETRKSPFWWKIYAVVAICLPLTMGIGTALQSQINQRNDKVRALQRLHRDYRKLDEQKADTDAQLKQKALKEADMQRQIDELNKQLQAKKERAIAAAARVVAPPTAYASPSAAPAPPAVAPAGCGIYHTGNTTVDTLINRESGGRTCVTNYLGCYGILQACPGEPLRQACGADGACQFAWFTNNKLGRYGSWEAALAHSFAFNWW